MCYFGWFPKSSHTYQCMTVLLEYNIFDFNGAHSNQTGEFCLSYIHHCMIMIVILNAHGQDGHFIRSLISINIAVS